MSIVSGTNSVDDGLIFHYDTSNSKFFKGKPVENRAPADQRTCSVGLARMSWHVEPYYYELTQAYGRADVIKVTCNPLGSATTAPYADFGFYASKSGGSVVGDVYWVSFEYKNVGGGGNPGLSVAYTNGYKNPDSGAAATLTNYTVIDLPDGWRRFSCKATITRAGSTWWRFGQGSANQDVEFYIDNFQIIHSDVDAPFVDGTRASTDSLLDITGNYIIDTPSLTYTSDHDIQFNNTSYIPLPAGSVNLTNKSFTIEAVVKPTNLGVNRTFFGHVEPVFADGKAIHFRIYPSGQLRFDFYSGSVNTAGGAISANQTYHLVATYSVFEDTTRMYINGVLVASGAVGPYIGDVNTSTTVWGAWTPSGSEYFVGEMPVAKIHKTALTADQIQRNYRVYKAKYNI